MLLPLIVSSLLAATPAASSPPIQQQTLLCQSDLPPIRGRRAAWFNLIVGEDHEVQSASVFLRFDHLDAMWSASRTGLTRKPRLLKAEYFVDIPTSARFPVEVRVLVNGKERARQRFDQPTNALRVVEIPGLFGARSLQLRAVDIGGRQVAEEQVSLPDWSWLRKETQLAAGRAESERQAGRCGPSVYI